MAAIRTAPGAAAEPAFLTFVAMTPCRVVDTRASSMFPSGFGQPSLSNGVVRNFAIQSSTLCTIPFLAQAYSFNVTVIPNPLGTAIQSDDLARGANAAQCRDGRRLPNRGHTK